MEPECEPELIALALQHLSQGRVATEENCDLANLLLSNLCKHLVPVWPARVCPRFETSHQIPASLFMEEVHRHLEENRFHVRPLKSRCHVHVHFQEPAQSSSDLSLFNLQLGKQVDKPFKTFLVPVDPKEVNLFEVAHNRVEVVGPLVLAAWATSKRLTS